MVINMLKPSNEKIKPKSIYGFDIETYGENNNFLMGSLVNETEKYVFWSKSEMQQFLLNNRSIKGSLIFATNIGFDFLGLFGEDINILSKFNLCIKGSDFIFITYSDSQGKITFMDTMNFLKCSVDSLGKILKVPKMDKPKNIGKFCIRKSKEGQYLEKYNIRDSYISFKFGEFLQKSFNNLGCNIKVTIASTSMHLFKNKYLKDYIVQPKKEILKEMFKGYYGGRTETFFRGNIEHCKLYDINSLYPYVMNKYKFPFPNTIKKGVNLNKEGLTLCDIKTPNNLFIPLLPYRTLNKLYFPLGNFQGWHTNIEIRKALKLGYKIKPLRGYYFEKTFNPFKNFIQDLYKKRLKTKGTPYEIVFKILMNSLYGKFAQKIEYQDILFRNNPEHFKKLCKIFKEHEKYNIDFPDKNYVFKDGVTFIQPRIYYVSEKDAVKYPSFINPILSIYITSYARLELYKWFEYILKNNGCVYYCDTDSVITNIVLPVGEKLGEMKEEINIKKGIIVKPKMYYLEDYKGGQRFKIKGLHGLKDYLELKEILEGKPFTYMKFTKFKESVRNPDLNFNQKVMITKYLDLEDNKRLWNNNFNDKIIEKSKPVKFDNFI